jgi:hypothetical protein
MALGISQKARGWTKWAPTMSLALLLSLSMHPAAAFTDKEAHEIFDILDPEHHGKVTLTDFQMNKVNAFFWRQRHERGEVKPLVFEETGLSREFFDKADSDHKGYLNGTDITYAIRFEDIDTMKRGYFDYADLVIYLKKIGR